MTITRDTGFEYGLRILSDYACLSDDLDSSRGISQIASEEIPISSGGKKKLFGRIR